MRTSNVRPQTELPLSQLHFGRIPITDVQPVVDGGAIAAKAVPGQSMEVAATVFRDGHDRLGVTAVLFDPRGKEYDRTPLIQHVAGTDKYTGRMTPASLGQWSFAIEGWSDLYGTWRHNAEVKIDAGVDVELMLAEGAALLKTAAGDRKRDKADRDELRAAAAALRNKKLSVEERLGAGISAAVLAAVERRPVRDLVTSSVRYPIHVERTAAGRGSWYEFFPRSEGAELDPASRTWTSGTFRTAAARLDAIAAMGFDVVYLPPIHPIGRTHRKGPNNTLVAGPGDPGSPWAIGSEEGGHDAIHPDLGSFADFDAFVARAAELGMEVALDFALQTSPDHPWVSEHPEWFTTRVDGSIAYAENPPKKYQDIYPLNFDNDPAALSAEVLRVLKLWISHGVKIFRVDNPHTKPVWFWEWLIGTVNKSNPEVVFLAEAFTRPPMMHALGKAGFQQSYSYFTWRNTKQELEEYFSEVSHETAAFFRPNFFVNTPDILTEYLQYGGPPAFKIRAVLALASPLWGVYSGYELYEHVARPGAEEYIDNEKFEYRPRDYAAAEESGRSLAPYLSRLNEIRRMHPALQDLENITIHSSTDAATLVFSKHKRTTTAAGGLASGGHAPGNQAPATDGEAAPHGEEAGEFNDTIIVVVNLDPHSVRESTVSLDLAALELDDRSARTGIFRVDDLLTGNSWQWGADNYVRLDAHIEPAHILHVRTSA